MIDADLEALTGETVTDVAVDGLTEYDDGTIGGLKLTFESGRTLNLVASGDGESVYVMVDLRGPSSG
jgi:hypothetical protein